MRRIAKKMRQLLQMFRDHGPMTSREVLAKMESDDWCFNTVRIYCARCNVRGHLRRIGKSSKANGQQYIYEITKQGLLQLQDQANEHKPTRNFGEVVADVVKEAVNRKVPNSVWGLA